MVIAERVRAGAMHHKVCPECGAAFITDQPQVVACTLRCNTKRNQRPGADLNVHRRDQTEPDA